MSAAPRPFFLDVGAGQRFCLFHAPSSARARRGAIVYLHPFAEELNKTRRMAALGARNFAALGYAVLQIDLYGCGDSSGEFACADWQTWRDDVTRACDWLTREAPGPLHLWGLRLGALLALDAACSARHTLSGLILWHPCLDGAAALRQFLRLDSATQMMRPERQRATSVVPVRERLADGDTVEVGGYALNAALVDAISACKGYALTPPPCTIDWFGPPAPASVPACLSATALAQRWRAGGVTLRCHTIDQGTPFWSTNEITLCPTLLNANQAAFS